MVLERFCLAALAQVSGLGQVQMQRLLGAFPSPGEAWRASKEELEGAKALHSDVLEALLHLRKERPDLPKELEEQCGQLGISLCAMGEEGYPAMLGEIYRPPAVLFYRGSLPAAEKRVAMVGSRKASAYGKGVAEKIGMDLAKAGIAVVSGAAAGIDTASHCGALRGGRTIAVLGCGVDVAYPRENRKLLEQIAEHGAVVSEYAPGTQPLPALFPARNRIISGLSRGVAVIEAAERSGSLITAEFAVSENREVFAVPGSIFSPMSCGCHHLIQQGAKLITSAADIMEELDWESGHAPAGQEEPPKMSAEEASIYRALSWDQPLSMDEIIVKVRDNAANISFLLMQMQLKGWIRETDSRGYVRSV